MSTGRVVLTIFLVHVPFQPIRRSRETSTLHLPHPQATEGTQEGRERGAVTFEFQGTP